MALWLYVEGLTSDKPWHMQTKHLVQLCPFIFGLIITGLIISLPMDMRQILFSEEYKSKEFFSILSKLTSLSALKSMAVVPLTAK